MIGKRRLKHGNRFLIKNTLENGKGLMPKFDQLSFGAKDAIVAFLKETGKGVQLDLEEIGLSFQITFHGSHQVITQLKMMEASQ